MKNMKYTHDNLRIKLTGQDDNLQLEVYTLTKIIYANPRRKKKKVCHNSCEQYYNVPYFK